MKTQISTKRKIRQICLLMLTFCLANLSYVCGQNPIVKDVGMADPHVYIWNNTAYLFTSRDGAKKSHYVMPDWRVWSSPDLVNWTERYTIDPRNTYMGKSNQCWAGAAARKNGKYYWYFSNGFNETTGVMVADQPTGPFSDALGKALLDTDATPGPEYDPALLVDDDGSAYIIAGHNRMNDPNYNYYIAKLNDDMISLSEKPKEIKITNPRVVFNNDKPSIHKRNGKYYLSAAVWYAVSDNIYGPYTIRGKVAPLKNDFQLDGPAHGNFFTWHNQWFHTWTGYVYNPDIHYRESYMVYLHYKDNGDMVDDVGFLQKHFATGIGRYDANWDEIEAEWYMKADSVEKRESPQGGFEIQRIKNNGTLVYPNVSNLITQESVTFSVASRNGGTIEVRANNATGKLLGTCEVTNTGGWSIYKDFTCNLNNLAGVSDICIKFIGSGQDLMHLDKFKFNTTQPSSYPLVHLTKYNAQQFALDAGFGGANNQSVKLWSANTANVNQQWEEIPIGNGYYQYRKVNTNYCIDGGNGGTAGQLVKLWQCNSSNQNQHWQKVKQDDNVYRLQKRNAAAYSIDGMAGGENGRQTVLTTNRNSLNSSQAWLFRQVSNKINDGKEPNEITNEIQVFPNPAHDILHINVSAENLENGLISITNIAGKKVLEKGLYNKENQINVQHLQQGLYFVTLKIGDATVFHKKLMKN